MLVTKVELPALPDDPAEPPYGAPAAEVEPLETVLGVMPVWPVP